ncbi:hypothetical protein, partial [Rhodococcus sp. IEGM 1307]|uniref:hypothetical protein n=1 Tax=Rhodococcus sp. IEGM 1307 TaxID=3047091 RepID=UPI0024B7AB18
WGGESAYAGRAVLAPTVVDFGGLEFTRRQGAAPYQLEAAGSCLQQAASAFDHRFGHTGAGREVLEGGSNAAPRVRVG